MELSYWLVPGNVKGVGKLPQSFFLVEIGPPNNQSAAFVGCFDNYVFALTKIFYRRSLFRRQFGKFGVTIEIKFIDVMTAFIDESKAPRKYLCPRCWNHPLYHGKKF